MNIDDLPRAMLRVLQNAAESNRWGQYLYTLIQALITVTPGVFWVFVKSKENLPDEVAGVILLRSETTYILTTVIDLGGCQVMGGTDTVLIGGSSENCGLISTGLSASLPLLMSNCTMPLRHLFITHDIALALDGQLTPDAALDWSGVNFVDCGVIGTIENYANVILKDGAFLNSGALTFDGSIDTIAIDGSLISVPAGQVGIILPATLTITRRFRAIYSAFIAGPASATVIQVDDVSIFANNESFILDTIAFSGSGTFLDGISNADNVALISNCSGIANSANTCQYFMSSNAVVTSLVVEGTYYKVAGVTTEGAISEKFDCGSIDNRAIYKGALTGFFKVSAVATYTDGNNQEIGLRIAKNGVTIPDSTSINSTGAGGRAQGASVQGIASLTFDDYVEIWAANNTSDPSSLVVTDINVIIERI